MVETLNRRLMENFTMKGSDCRTLNRLINLSTTDNDTIRHVQFSSIQSLSHVRLFATPWIIAHQASLSITSSRVHSNSCPSSRWWHPAISSSVVPFSSCPQSLPVSESFPMSQLFTWGGQSTGVSALASFLPKKSQGGSSLVVFCTPHSQCRGAGSDPWLGN